MMTYEEKIIRVVFLAALITVLLDVWIWRP